jgi:hypothetical protein
MDKQLVESLKKDSDKYSEARENLIKKINE